MSFRFRWDPVKTVCALVERWKPINCAVEKDYEDSLYEFLHQQLPSVQVARQWAFGRTRIDMRVGDKVMIELKTNLDTTGEYQRLLGQILELKKREEPIVVILTGSTDPYFLKE